MPPITTAVLHPPPDRFPPGTSVSAYRSNAWSGTDRSVPPTGAADVGPFAVAGDGSLTFTGLTDQTTYFAWSSGSGPPVRFSTRHDNADDIRTDTAKLGNSQTWAGNNVFTTGLTIGPIAPLPRQPIATRIPVNPAQTGTADHIGHLFKSVVDGPWAEVAGDDPNMAWGVNVFTLFQNDNTGLLVGWGALIEADVSSPAGISFARIAGLQAEASFFGASAGATVTTLESLYVAQPVRKGGAVAGTATNTYGLRIGPVRASNTGATTALGLFVQGLGSSAGVGQSLFQGTVTINPQNAGDVSLILKAPAAPTVDIFQVKDSASAILSRFDKSGYFMTKKVAAPADADLTSSEMALWFDATNGAAKLMIKAKQADGTVRTGSVALA